MTKEELKKEAEKYVIKKHHIDKTKLPIDFSLSCEFSDDFTDFQNGAEFGYQKGVQELDKKWHSLQKNPKDLPEPHSTVLDECGNKITYRGGDMWTVYSEYYEKDIDAEPPKAWCEVPTFEE